MVIYFITVKICENSTIQMSFSPFSIIVSVVFCDTMCAPLTLIFLCHNSMLINDAVNEFCV